MTSLKLGDLQLWSPPRIVYELTGSRSNYSSNACGSTLDSIDLTYKLYISGDCSLAEAQNIEQDIRTALATAPNLMLERQDTNDALVFTNFVKKGSLDYSSDQTDLRARFTRKRTLGLQLALTILPEGEGGGGAAFRHLKYIAATGDFNWEDDDIFALLFDADSTIPDELYAETLDDFINISELPYDGPYTRQFLLGREVIEGSIVELVAEDPEFLDNGGATGMLIFQENGSNETSIPLFVISFAELDGSESIIHLDLTGLF